MLPNYGKREIDLMLYPEAISQVTFETTPIRFFVHGGQTWVARADFFEASGFRRSGFRVYAGEPEALRSNDLLVKLDNKSVMIAAVNRAWIEGFLKSNRRRRRKQKEVYNFLCREVWDEDSPSQGTLFTQKLTDADAREFAERVWHHFEKLLNTYHG